MNEDEQTFAEWAESRTAAAKKPDRFDLEQAILNAWCITDDLKLYKGEDNAYIDGVIAVYERKMEVAWEIFEELIAQRRLV